MPPLSSFHYSRLEKFFLQKWILPLSARNSASPFSFNCSPHFLNEFVTSKEGRKPRISLGLPSPIRFAQFPVPFPAAAVLVLKFLYVSRCHEYFFLLFLSRRCRCTLQRTRQNRRGSWGERVAGGGAGKWLVFTEPRSKSQLKCNRCTHAAGAGEQIW